MLSLLREPMDVAMHSSHDLAMKRTLKPSDLVGTTWISTHAGFSPADMLDAVAAAAGYPMRVVHRINDFSTAAAMVSESGHLALLPRHTVRIPASQDVVLRPLEGVQTVRHVDMLVRPERVVHRAVAVVIDALRGIAQSHVQTPPQSGAPMPKNPRDEIDAQILAELRRNARISLAQLGGKVLLSRNAVRQRIERLERDGFINGYTIKESAGNGAPTVNAVLLIQRQDRMRGGDVIAGLRAIPEITTCDVVSGGELDLIARVEAPDAARIQEIWRQVSEFPGVRDTTTALSLSTVIDRQTPR